MDWHRITKEGFPPKPENGKDVDVLLKIENAPMLYVAATWDGERFWVLSVLNEAAPWATLPNWVKPVEWAYIENPPKNETHKLGWVAKDSDDIVRFCSVEPVKDREDWMAEDEFYWMVPGGASIVCELGFNKDLIVDKDHPRKAELVIKITE